MRSIVGVTGLLFREYAFGAAGGAMTMVRSSRRDWVVEVVAQIPDLMRPGMTAQMTYYETPAGAKVFSAGAINFGGSAEWPVVTRLLDNLWGRLSRP